MFLNILALLSAISISGVAAYYSIAGLTAIFSGAVIPIIIMGGVLEFGKIITTVWLHQNWNRVNFLVKWYLALAVLVLMFVTSMGIFGYLSRAHIETTSSVGDNTLLIEQIDQNLGVEQQRIKDNQAVIKQMDDAVNGLLSGSASNATKDNNRTATLATQATKLRDSQKKDREAANKTIDDTNKRIQDLNSQKLKLNQAQLKVEAEVGPIKYIAQLIYGDNVDKSSNYIQDSLRTTPVPYTDFIRQKWSALGGTAVPPLGPLPVGPDIFFSIVPLRHRYQLEPTASRSDRVWV